MRKKFLMFVSCAVFLTSIATGPNAATIYVPDNFKTISEAVRNASPNDTIIVDSGTYTENVVITKPLAIKSSKGADASIVHALIKSEPTFKVSNVKDAAIIGFTATGSDIAGIYLYNSSNDQILGNKTIGNGIGMFLRSSDDNILSKNISNTNEQYGIYLESSNGNTLEKNSVNSNRDKGIFLNSSSRNNLTSNNVKLNAWDGIFLWSSHNNMLKDNRILRNTYGIVLSDSNNNDLTGNSTWSNIYIILPVVLIYIGIIVYLIQKNLVRFIYRE